MVISNIYAANVDEAVDKLINAMKSTKGNNTAQNYELNIQQLDYYKKSRNQTALEMGLMGVQMTSQFPDLMVAYLDLKMALEEQKAAGISALNEKAEAMIAEASSLIETAKEPRDLDGLLNRFNELLGSNTSWSEHPQRLANAQRFMTQWQDYLAAKKAGEAKQMRQVLESLKGSQGEAGLMPRSRILEMLHALEPKVTPPAVDEVSPEVAATAIFERMDSLEGMSEGLNELSKLSARSTAANQINQAINELSRLERHYREFVNGLAISVSLSRSMPNSISNPVIERKLIQLKSEFLKLILPRYVEGPPGMAAKKDETVEESLSRWKSEALERRDAELAYRLTVASHLVLRGEPTDGQERQSLRAYQAGKNQEAAGQYALAVISYQEALKHGGTVVSAEEIGERLRAIQASHPEAYAEGREEFLHPTRTRREPGNHKESLAIMAEALRKLEVPAASDSERDSGAVTPDRKTGEKGAGQAE